LVFVKFSLSGIGFALKHSGFSLDSVLDDSDFEGEVLLEPHLFGEGGEVLLVFVLGGEEGSDLVDSLGFILVRALRLLELELDGLLALVRVLFEISRAIDTSVGLGLEVDEGFLGTTETVCLRWPLAGQTGLVAQFAGFLCRILIFLFTAGVFAGEV
jgi:hypothetical protein